MRDLSLAKLELSFYQKIRKKLYLLNMNEKKATKYFQLPNILKNDEDIIKEVFNTNPNMINSATLSSETIRIIIKQIPQLLKSISNFDIKKELVMTEPTLVEYLSENDIIEFYDFAKRNYDGKMLEIVANGMIHLSEAMQKSILKGEQIEYLSNGQSKKLQVDLKSIGIHNFLEPFVLSMATSRKESFLNLDMSSLSMETQLKLLLLDNDYKKIVSQEAIAKFVGDNPLLFDLLPPEIAPVRGNSDAIEEKNEYLRDKNKYTINEFSKTHDTSFVIEMLKLNPAFAQKNYTKIIERETVIPLLEELCKTNSASGLGDLLTNSTPGDIKLISLMKFLTNDDIMNAINNPEHPLLEQDLIDYLSFHNSREYVLKHPEIIAEHSMANFREYLVTNISTINIEWILDHISAQYTNEIDIYMSDYDNQFMAYVSSIKDRLNRDIMMANYEQAKMNNFKYGLPYKSDVENYMSSTPHTRTKAYLSSLSEEEKSEYISKLSHEDLLECITSLSEDEISKIIKDLNINITANELLSNIIGKVYGEKSAQIVKDRPQADMTVIPNLYVFHPNIVNEFSIGATHATLSYDMPITSAQFSELARNPQKMEEYKRFSQLTSGFFGDTAIDLENKLLAFEYSRDLLTQIPMDEQINDTQKENLELAITDLIAFRSAGTLPFPDDIQQLSEYSAKRDKFFHEGILKLTNEDKIKDCISRHFFGMKYQNDIASLRDICKIYNLREFLNDDRTLSSNNLSQSDLDRIEVLDIINSVTNIGVLQNLAFVLKENEHNINPLKYKGIAEKVSQQYSQEFINTLMTPEKAEEMIEKGMPGISMREKDGIKIITLSGIDFFAYVTNPTYNLSDRTQDGFTPNKWREYENGISAISGSMINQSETNCLIAKGHIGLGISPINPNQIIVMRNNDAGISHDKRQLKVTYDYGQYMYPDDLMQATTDRIKMGLTLFNYANYNEIASHRRIQELSQIQPGTYGGKIMPNYIYANGKGVGDIGIKWAQQFGIKYIFEYDDEAYIDYTKPLERHEEKAEVTIKESDFIRKVRHIREGAEYDR